MRKQGTRVEDHAAYVLHATPWRETSLIAQVLARDYGRIAIVAKGAKRPYSGLRPVLSVFQPLRLSWVGKGEVKTLTRAEAVGICPLRGRALMSAWYMNELLLQLLPRDDAHPILYDAYDTALRQLAVGSLTAASLTLTPLPLTPARLTVASLNASSLNTNSRTAGVLRRFEWILLRETGYGVGEVPPDFEDPALEPRLRQDLRERLAQNMSERPLVTRRVRKDWQCLLDRAWGQDER